MDSRSPAKVLSEKCIKSLGLFSPTTRSKELVLNKDRRFAALNLSIRKKRNILREAAIQQTFTSIKLLKNEEIFNLAEKSINVICKLQSPNTFRSKKNCNIINEERGNYEPVDMTVDLCSQFHEEDNSEIEQNGSLKLVKLSSNYSI